MPRIFRKIRITIYLLFCLFCVPFELNAFSTRNMQIVDGNTIAFDDVKVSINDINTYSQCEKEKINSVETIQYLNKLIYESKILIINPTKNLTVNLYNENHESINLKLISYLKSECKGK